MESAHFSQTVVSLYMYAEGHIPNDINFLSLFKFYILIPQEERLHTRVMCVCVCVCV